MDRSSTPMTFKVLGDGKVLWASPPVQDRGMARECRVDVSGVSKLELVVECPGYEGKAHAVWVEPRLSGGTLADLTPARPAAQVPADAVSFGGHRYRLYAQPMSWHDAKRFCEQLGGHLVTITSKEENDFVTDLARRGGSSVWIGFTDERQEGKWEWVTGEEWTFTAWAPGNPSGSHAEGIENWGNLLAHKGYLWNDEHAMGCFFLCEWEPPARTVWIEGEKAVRHNFRRHGWYDSVDKSRLSNGEWLSHYREQEAGEAAYEFDVAQAGRYVLWLRCNPVQSQVSYRLDGGERTPVDFANVIDRQNLVQKRDHRFIGWVRLGAPELAAGRHTLEFRLTGRIANSGAIDCICLTKDTSFIPSGAKRPPEAPARAMAEGPAYDEDARGLLGTYYADTELRRRVMERVDPRVDFNWRQGSPAPGMPKDNFSVRWEGAIVPPATGAYVLTLKSDDGARLWVRGRQLLDNWGPQTVTLTLAPIPLEAGRPCEVKLEYMEGPGDASVSLLWTGPGVPAAVPIPSECLRPPQTVDLERGLVGHWEFDEGEGTTARDSSGRGRRATLHKTDAAGAWGDGMMGKALKLDGVDDHVTLANVPDIHANPGRFTVAAWIRPEQTSGTRRYEAIFGKGYSCGIHWDKYNKQFALLVKLSDGREVKLYSKERSENRWAHVAMTFDRGGSSTGLYVNGKPSVRESWAGTASQGLTLKASSKGLDDLWMLGNAGLWGPHRYKGLIDDVRIYDRALSAKEIQALFKETERIAAAEAAARADRRASARLETFLSGFDALVGKGDYAGARGHLATATTDEELARFTDELAAARGVCEVLEARRKAVRRAVETQVGGQIELRTTRGKLAGKVRGLTDEAVVLMISEKIRGAGTVETRMPVKWADLTRGEADGLARKGGWKPEGPAAAVARAILALGRRDVKSARLALAAAGDHPLAAHLRAKVASPGTRVDSEPAGPGKPVGPAGPVRPAKRKPVNYARFVALRELKGHAGAVISARFSPDGRTVVTASKDMSARTWDSGTGEALRVMKGYAYGVKPAEFSPDGRMIMTAPSNVWVQLWDASTGEKAVRSPGHGSGAHAHHARFGTSGRLVVSAGKENVLVWETTTGQLRHRLVGHTKAVRAVALSADDRRVITVASDNTARIWDEAGNSLHVLKIGGLPEAAAFSPDGRLAVTSSPVRIWDAKTGAPLAKFDGHAFAEFSPDGKLLLTIAGKEVHVRDLRRGRVLHKLRGHSAKITSAAFSRDGRWVATASEDMTARIWQVASGLTARKLVGHASAVLDVSFSPDGRMVATASLGRSACIWGEPRRR
ncbi:MAG: PA14 domain-containing protein, partial [Planctomycetota bacterium]|jgi:WD40 repeat protein